MPFKWLLFAIAVFCFFPTCYAQLPSTDIFLADFTAKDNLRIGTPINITQKEGYDNQPFFISDTSFAYSSSFEDQQTDIMLYEIQSGKSRVLRTTRESEYSPTLTPDGKHLSCIRAEADGSQRLWQFPLDGGEPTLLLSSLKTVGYHCWLDPQTLALFLVGEPHQLVKASLPNGDKQKWAEDIGRGMALRPEKNALVFIAKTGEKQADLMQINAKTGKPEKITATPQGSEDLVWVSSHQVLMAHGSAVYHYDLKKNHSWQKIADLSSNGLTQITRLALNPSRTKLAIVAIPNQP